MEVLLFSVYTTLSHFCQIPISELLGLLVLSILFFHLLKTKLLMIIITISLLRAVCISATDLSLTLVFVRVKHEIMLETALSVYLF